MIKLLFINLKVVINVIMDIKDGGSSRGNGNQ